MKTKRGFTIIELLVSLAIIGVLFSVVLVLTNTVRENSRDAKRMSDMREMSKALVLYADNTNNFPIATTAIIITGSDAVSIALENEKVITEMPTDPTGPTNPYTYQTDSRGDTFTISFCLETNTIDNYSKGCGNTISP